SLNPDGTLRNPPEIVDRARMFMPGQERYRSAAESARRSVLKAAPFQLPPGDREKWAQEVILNFDPRQTLGGKDMIQTTSRRWLALPAWAAALLLIATLAQQAVAAVEIDITRGNFRPVPIAISDFDADNPQANRLGQDVARVIRANLERSGLFKPVD